MEKFFIPYKADKPASICVNGHRLIIVTTDSDTFEATELEHDSVQEVECEADDLENMLAHLGTEHSTGVVLAPSDIEHDELIASLSEELPWIQ